MESVAEAVLGSRMEQSYCTFNFFVAKPAKQVGDGLNHNGYCAVNHTITIVRADRAE